MYTNEHEWVHGGYFSATTISITKEKISVNLLIR